MLKGDQIWIWFFMLIDYLSV